MERAVNNDEKQMAEKTSARRRLLRGAFSAPAALTLCSGSAFAAASATCVARQAGSPESPPASSSTDGYVRVRLIKFQARKKSDGSLSSEYSVWVQGSDVYPLRAPGKSAHLSSTQWQLFSKTNQSAYKQKSVGWKSDSEPIEGSSGDETVKTLDQWVALRVNSVGDIVGVVGIDSTTNTSAVSHSCWSSFKLNGL